MQIAASEFLGGHHLAGRGLYQRRSSQEDGALVAHDHCFVAHRGNVGSAGGARTKHRGDLGDPGRAHGGLVVEDAPEMIAVGKDLVLPRQECSTGIHQVNTGQPILRRNLLGPEVFFDRDRVVGAAFDRGVVGHDHAFPSGNPTDSGNDPRRRAFVVVHTVGGQRSDLQQWAARVEQPVDPFTRKQLASFDVTLSGALRAPESRDGQLAAQFGDQRHMRLAVCGRR